ncbi:hypothetical protein LPJ73_001379 [Coemansia sp. RSA 2703]|nr:hypothetical protein LPJ73_001379 [Coemansia sp. RSA 2703]KAJ2374554.1 hypothetical protein IW150_003041 [Coemansia sp. RSA 2607]KAJ2393212.1 hypothetical protein GGI05_002477 [Coemansia sp. RSA 2603]
MSQPFPTIEFGVPGNRVTLPRIGLGAMGMSGGYGSYDDSESVKVLNHAIDIGCNLWDTSNMYGFGENEILLSKVLKERRDDIFVSTKFGLIFSKPGPDFDGDYFKVITGVCGTPEYVRECAEASLKSLGVDKIDLFYQHRVDPKVPIEDTVAAMAELVKEGKVRYLGLCECSADELRRAYKVHPIAAVQYEYSPWFTVIESNGVLDVCRELGIALVAYAPLGRGLFTGTLRNADGFDKYDWRFSKPRFQAENIQDNLKLVDAIGKIAKRHNVTTAQLTLAWVLAQYKNMIVIPGTKRINYLEENFAAGQVKLTDAEIKEVRDLVETADIKGNRY